jgi:excisionase family DNA binding protein
MSPKKIGGPDDLMTAADAARILELSSDMVRLMARNGSLPYLSTVSGIRLFKRSDVDALAERRKTREGTKRISKRKPRAGGSSVSSLARAK